MIWQVIHNMLTIAAYLLQRLKGMSLNDKLKYIRILEKFDFSNLISIFCFIEIGIQCC